MKPIYQDLEIKLSVGGIETWLTCNVYGTCVKEIPGDQHTPDETAYIEELRVVARGTGLDLAFILSDSQIEHIESLVLGGDT